MSIGPVHIRCIKCVVTTAAEPCVLCKHMCCSVCTYHHFVTECKNEDKSKTVKTEDEVSDDSVDHPSHYNTGKIEVMDFIEDQKLGFHLGNTIKYICRSEHKGNRKEDLEKASWYLRRFIESLE